MKEKIIKLIQEGLKSLDLEVGDFVVEHPVDLKMGDYFTNVAIKSGHKEEVVEYLNKNKPKEIERIELAGPGFINFFLSKEFFKNSIGEIIKKDKNFGKSEHDKGSKVMVEHTDPNPFKEFHIGHLMPNVIGSVIANIFEWNGAEVKQANYQGDIGLHVAKAIWSLRKKPGSFLTAYADGHKAYIEDPNAKVEIEEVNKRLYDGADSQINTIYSAGLENSLEYFDSIYKKLGTSFDFSFFESETAPIGKKIVLENIGKVFEEGEGGAIVFKGEKFDPSLHTRVFINSQGIPTYEAKDLGNAKNKYYKYPYDFSIIVTGNEIKDYFRVVLEAMKQIMPDLAEKTKHLPHGILRLSSGKMSSRTGDVIAAEELIEDVKKKVKDDEQVAIGAIKYMILRQAIGNDIIFDIDKSVSTEGDSGVYLQYAYARTNSLLEKAKMLTLGVNKNGQDDKIRGIERLLYRFPEVVERAGKEYAPHHITTYLTQLASSFNNFYAHEQVIGDSKESSYRLAIVKAFNIVMKNGLEILGIPAPERL